MSPPPCARDLTESQVKMKHNRLDTLKPAEDKRLRQDQNLRITPQIVHH